MISVTASSSSVIGTFMNMRIVKAPMIFSVEITMFSGPWCASSEMSNRSLTSFDIISPVLLRS